MSSRTCKNVIPDLIRDPYLARRDATSTPFDRVRTGRHGLRVKPTTVRSFVRLRRPFFFCGAGDPHPNPLPQAGEGARHSKSNAPGLLLHRLSGAGAVAPSPLRGEGWGEGSACQDLVGVRKTLLAYPRYTPLKSSPSHDAGCTAVPTAPRTALHSLAGSQRPVLIVFVLSHDFSHWDQALAASMRTLLRTVVGQAHNDRLVVIADLDCLLLRQGHWLDRAAVG